MSANQRIIAGKYPTHANVTTQSEHGRNLGIYGLWEFALFVSTCPIIAIVDEKEGCVVCILMFCECEMNPSRHLIYPKGHRLLFHVQPTKVGGQVRQIRI